MWNYEDALRAKFVQEEHARQEVRARAVARRHARAARAEMATHLTEREREDLAWKLQKAMVAGDAEPWRLGVFDRDPVGALEGILPHIAEKYGFPQFEVLSKSAAAPEGILGTGLPRDDISERLQVAVRHGALPPNVLSGFDANPEKTLRAIPERVCKAFSIPQPGTEALHKGTPNEDLVAAARALERVITGR